MTIALIAHDSKKELMVQFCTAYCRILSQHKLVATGTTGKLISEATGLQVQRFLAGVQGGDQQIASRIACNEIFPVPNIYPSFLYIQSVLFCHAPYLQESL